MAREVVSRVELQKVVRKYEIMGDASKRKRIWEEFKWSFEFKSMDSLRSKLLWPFHLGFWQDLSAYFETACLSQCGDESTFNLYWQVCSIWLNSGYHKTTRLIQW